MIAAIDWAKAFGYDHSPLELVLRGTAMYLGLFVLLRLGLKRQSGSIGLGDTLLIVLMADAAQNGMVGEYTSVPEGLTVVGTLYFWNFALDWLGDKWPPLGRLLEGEPTVLVRRGKLDWDAMDREGISEGELMAQLRLAGVDHPKRAKRATLEPEGRISVVPFEPGEAPEGEPPQTPGVSPGQLADLFATLGRLEAKIERLEKRETP